jgi:hypothetical protein
LFAITNTKGEHGELKPQQEVFSKSNNNDHHDKKARLASPNSPKNLMVVDECQKRVIMKVLKVQHHHSVTMKDISRHNSERGLYCSARC